MGYCSCVKLLIAKFTADKEMTILDFSKKQGYSKPLNIKVFMPMDAILLF